ncbi:hypothetical protein [Puia dinghuensis]|uniref:Uncharacterized protein n=1 Tax=Puia dinghuensis TaxID=1792502 RepID=A0A8J2UDV9_9BACT|nr:hypothetical protein [Puia dinghuensis]GGB01799.1 hypothetical protein GCM10011511_26260 [Puia dinghuensis]
MSNALLLHCKETHKQTNEAIAAALKITPEQYEEIEDGEVLITYKQAEALGQLYGTHGTNIYTSVLQLDTLLAQRQVIKILKFENDQLKEKLRKTDRPTPAKNKKTRKTTPAS